LLIDFRRLRNNRLSVASLQTFCEDTYDKYLVSQKHINEQTQHIEEQVKKDAQRDLRLKEALEKKETSKSDVDSREQTYYHTFRVPNLDETSTEERPDKKDVRKSLEDQIIRLTKEQIKNIFCDDKKEFMITVPKFNPGDPQVFILIESIALGSQAIETISFDREENGHYVVYPVKMLELPDEVTVLRDKILKNRMLEQKVQCK
jgi:hypothetical protein